MAKTDQLGVLHIDTELTWRGGENQLRLLVEGLMDGYPVRNHLACRPESAIGERLSPKIPAIRLPMPNDLALRSAWEMARYCKENDISLIDAHTARGHGLAVATKTFHPELKIVVHKRTPMVPRHLISKRFKYQTPKVDRYVAISQEIANQLRGSGIPHQHVEVVKSAVVNQANAEFDKEKSRRVVRELIKCPLDAHVVGTAAHLSPQKGIDTLIRAAARQKESGQEFHTIVIGQGQLWDPLHQLAQQLGMEDRIHFLGFRTNAREIISGLDVFALPSNVEGLGTVVLDAISLETPVIGSKTGGIPEMVIHEKTGFLFDPGDDQRLFNLIQRCLHDPIQLQPIVEAAKQHTESQFSLHGMVHGNWQVYQDVLGLKDR